MESSSLFFDDNNTSSLWDEDETERDEVLEIEKNSAQLTHRVFFWRLVVTLGLTLTGVTVTAWSYSALLKQETNNFENAYAQFSRTVGQAAMEEIWRLQEAARIFAETMEATAKLTNTTWPFYDYYDGLGTFAEEQVNAKDMESMAYLTRVTHDQRDAYLEFQNKSYQAWVKAGHLQAYGNLDLLFQGAYQDDILEFNTTDFSIGPSTVKDEYYPLAYRYPPPNSYFVVNFDIKSINYDDLFASLLQLGNQTLLSNVNPYIEGDEAEKEYHQQFHDQLPHAESQASFPHSFLFHPVRRGNELVAVVTFPLAWDASLRRLLPDAVEGIVAVARNNCNQSVTYEIVGPDAFFLGWEDLHDSRYNGQEYVVDLDLSDHPDFYKTRGHCAYSLSIYPSARFENAYKSNTPVFYVAIVGSTFALMILVFFVYDGMVQRRNRKIIRDAARSNEIVTSMFPGTLRDKVLNQKMVEGSSNMTWNKKSKQLARILENEEHGGDITIDDAEPLAELYTETTIIFADMVGFTKWSTNREPSEVFKLLETVYRAFDVLARKQKIFKVETVGDCYVAISGFPEKQDDHAARMCRFAAQCLKTFSRAVLALDPTLGTATLKLRVGIHSGQVTAGVLRGDRTRFQLFGDAMNTTSRHETTGEGGKVHISQATADLLKKDGLEDWIVRRNEPVHAKGLGYIRTYWLKYATARTRRESHIYVQYRAVEDRPKSNAKLEEVPVFREQAPSLKKVGATLGGSLSRLFDSSQKMLRLDEEIGATEGTCWEDEISI